MVSPTEQVFHLCPVLLLQKKQAMRWKARRYTGHPHPVDNYQRLSTINGKLHCPYCGLVEEKKGASYESVSNY